MDATIGRILTIVFGPLFAISAGLYLAGLNGIAIPLGPVGPHLDKAAIGFLGLFSFGLFLWSGTLRELRDMVRNPLAFFGGIGGTGAVFALFFITFAFILTGEASAEQEDEFEIEFTPGSLVKLGQEIDEAEQKVVEYETRVEEETVEETVTTDEEAAPKEIEEPEPDKKPKKKPKTQPTKIPKDKKLPTNKIPTKGSDPPSNLPPVSRGNPFGSPNGFSDIAKDGDPWATSVLAALNNVGPGTFGGKAPKGSFKFKITICKDGTIKTVQDRGGDLDSSAKNSMVVNLKQTKIPKPPARIARQMKRSCQPIGYVFRWSSRGVK